jgi:hypothetical protein
MSQAEPTSLDPRTRETNWNSEAASSATSVCFKRESLSSHKLSTNGRYAPPARQVPWRRGNRLSYQRSANTAQAPGELLVAAGFYPSLWTC